MKEDKSSVKKAVVLKYPEGAEAPIVMAKGEGKIADFIIQEAEYNEISIEKDDCLVEILSGVDTGTYVPEEAWQALSVIFSVILADRKKEK